MTGLGRAKDFSVHKLGHALGAKYDKAHGATLSAVWGSWAEYVYKNDEEKICALRKKSVGRRGRRCGESRKEGIRRTVEYFREIHMPTNLKGTGDRRSIKRKICVGTCLWTATLNDAVKTFKKSKELTAEDAATRFFRKAAGK
ncbi:MAG: iron-containing alcohol dehydrogenase [Coprococcus sp.]